MAKLVKCKTCGNDIAKTADTCPHCGAKNKRGCGCGVVIVVLLILLSIGAAMATGKSNAPASHNAPAAVREQPQKQPNAVVSSSLSYLRKVNDICRVDIVQNDVFISFKNNSLPLDYKLVANAAAVNASMALVAANEIPSRCTVWVIPADDPATVDHAYYSATARKGKLQ